MSTQNRDDILEELQEAIIFAGGRFFKRRELEAMPLGKVLEIVEKNNISTAWLQINNRPEGVRVRKASDAPDITSHSAEGDTNIFNK